MVACPLRREPVLQALGADPGCERGRVHVAVMREPWMTHVLEGRKTIESRFTKLPVPPHGVVAPGDLVLFKHAAGPVCAASDVTAVEFHDLRRTAACELRERHEQALCCDETFWSEAAEARYATLIHLGGVRVVPDLHLDKRDRRGWVVLDEGPHIHSDQLQLRGLAAPDPQPCRVIVGALEPIEPHPGQLALPHISSRCAVS